MPIYDIFSNRNRPRPEKLVYDTLSESLRQHCLRIIRQGIGDHEQLLERMGEVLQHEHPTPSFEEDRSQDAERLQYLPRFFEYCVEQGTFMEAMDAIEVGTQCINDDMRKNFETARKYGHIAAPQEPDDAIEELNGRFMQDGVGYQFSTQQRHLVRVDSAFMHEEVTEPAMKFLTEKGFEGAAQEFDKAHQHYRQMAVGPEAGKDAVAWSVKAIESTAKAIMDARAWAYDKNDTITKLLTKVVTKGLVPAALQSYFDGLRTALTSGLPSIGNAMARHGQGAKPKPIEEHMVTLTMHLAAATIRFLLEAHQAA